MLPLSAGAWSAIGSIGSSLLGGLFGSSGQSAANRMNYKIWQEQKAWSTEMSNTEVQRRVRDMMAAGINPMMAVNGGGAASTPSLPMPTMQNEKGAMAASAAQIASVLADVAVKKATAKNIEQDTYSKATGAALAGAQTTEVFGRVALLKQQVRNMEEDFKGIELKNKFQDLNNEQFKALMPILLEYERVKTALLGMGVAGAKNAEEFEKEFPWLARFMSIFRDAAATGSDFRR